MVLKVRLTISYSTVTLQQLIGTKDEGYEIPPMITS